MTGLLGSQGLFDLEGIKSFMSFGELVLWA